MRPRDRELHALILADGAPEDLALLRPARRALDEPAAIADALGGDQDALGVHAVEDVAEAAPLLADQAARRDRHVVEGQFVRLVIEHDRDRLDGQAVRQRVVQVDQEDGEAVRFALHLLHRRRAGQQEQQVGVLDAGDVDFPPVDDVAVAVARRGRRQARRVRARVRLGDAEGLQTQIAARDLRQILPLLRLGAVPQERAHHIHLRVRRPRIAAGVIDLFEDHRRLGEAHAEAAVLLRDQRAEQFRSRSSPARTPRDRRASGPIPASTRPGSLRRTPAPARVMVRMVCSSSYLPAISDRPRAVRTFRTPVAESSAR